VAGLEQLTDPAAASALVQHSGEDSEDEGAVGQVKEITQMEYIKDGICLLVASCTMLLANKAAVASPHIITSPDLH